MVQRKINKKTGNVYFLSEPSGPFYEPYTGKISSKLDPKYDDQDVDIFEGGPAGQVLVDIDPLYGGIQLQEDEKPGDQAMRDLARGAKVVTDVLTPSEETKAEIAERDRREQEAFAMLLKATGYDPESFEANQLEARLRKDNELRRVLNLPRGFGRALTDFRLGFGTAGQFLFGEANKGLTTMTEEGTKFKDLPFDQKLGIAILPIDLLDAVGITYGGAQVLKTLIKGGVKQFGKTSGKTVTDLLSDEQFLSKIETENPGFIKQLEELGIPPEAKFASRKKPVSGGIKPMTEEQRRAALDQRVREIAGAQNQKLKIGEDGRPIVEGIKPKTKKDIEAEEIRRTAEGLEGTFAGKQAQDPEPVRTRQRAKGINVSDPIADRLKNLDFKKLDPNKPDEIFKIINEERVKLGIPELTVAAGRTPDSSVVVKRLFENGFINKKTYDNIRAYQQERYNIANIKGRDKAKETKAKKAQDRADAAITLINDLKKNREEELFFDSSTLLKKLKEKYPKLFPADYSNKTSRSKLLKKLIEINPSIADNLIKPGQKIDPVTLTLIQDTPSQENVFAALFTETFRPGEDMVSLLKEDPEMRFFNNLRRSSGQSGEDFFQTVKLEDIQEGGDKYEDFLKFKKLDETRLEANKKLKPVLRKIFDKIRLATAKDRALAGEGLDAYVFDSISSVQLGHRFKLSGITEGFAADKIGRGAKAEEIYLDISDYNSYIQNGLENEARKNYKMFQETGDQKFMDRVSVISEDMEKLGIEGQVAPGVFLGGQKDFVDKIAGLIIPAMNSGLLTKAEVQQAITAANKIAKAQKEYRKMFGEELRLQKGGLITEDMNIFDDEKQGTIFPKISIEFGDAAKGTARRFGEEEPEDMVPLPLSEIQLGDAEPVRAAPQEKVFDVPPMENIFTGEVQEANLKLPFFKLFTKPPVNETAPIPTPKEALDNPTKKQKQSLEQEKLNKEQDFFDPTPEDNQKVNLGDSTDVAKTPKTNQPLIGVFYSDAEKVLQRPDAPVIFPNKQALIDYFAKNRIKKTELEDYGINNLLKAFDEVTPIPKEAVIRQIRSSPVRGMHVHGTGKGSEIINPSGEQVSVAYEGYRTDGFIAGTTAERILYIPIEKLPGDTGVQPRAIFQGEDIQNHGFGLPGGSDNNYIVGWTRLSERRALLPTKLDAPAGKSKIPGLTRERDRIQRQLAGLFAEAQNKLNAQAQRRGIPVDEVQAPSLEQMLSTYADTLNEISPGLVDQMDELIVKARDLDSEITKASTVDASNVVRVQFADEIQSDIMQAAAGRKQKLLATLRKLQEEGRESTTLPDLDRIGNEALAFFEKNKSVFRPLKKSQTEVDIFADSLLKVDADIDDIINRFVETREISDADITRVKSLLNDQIDQMINDLITVDANTYDGLFPDLPFKKREEWADALIKKDLFELAYRKFVLKDPNVPDYYAVTPDTFVINRYNFNGNTATSAADRAADKAEQIKVFTERGEFMKSRYRGIGMSEFYGGPNAVDQNGKHYTSTIEKILKTQAKSNNSEMIILNVQTKAGGSDVYRITDQNGNMVATLTDARQAQTIRQQNPNYNVEAIRVPDMKNTTPSFAIKITEEMLEPYKTHKARGGLVEMIDIFEVA